MRNYLGLGIQETNEQSLFTIYFQHFDEPPPSTLILNEVSQTQKENTYVDTSFELLSVCLEYQYMSEN